MVDMSEAVQAVERKVVLLAKLTEPEVWQVVELNYEAAEETAD